MPPLVIILHAPQEEAIAERLVAPIKNWGYDVWHTGNVLVGDVVVKELSDRLADNGPVVINGTTRAAGSKWLKTVLGHLQGHDFSKRVFPVRVEADAHLEGVCFGAKIAECEPNFSEGLRQLKEALDQSFPSGATQREEVPLGEPWEEFDNWLTTWTTFSGELLGAYRKTLRPEIRELKLGDDLDSLTFLSRANLVANGRLYASGVLLFTEHPEKLIPSAFVQCVLYRGTSRDSGQEGRDFYGPIQSQIEQAMLFAVTRTEKIEITEPGQAAARFIYRFPMICLREIVANAVCHRDYTVGDRHVHLRIFSNRIEVSSPGEWRVEERLCEAGCSLEELESESVTNNERLASALRWVKLVETQGSGIPNALADCRETNTPYPVVNTKDGFVRVTIFPRKDWDTEVISRRGHTAPGSTAPLAELPRPKRANDFEDLVLVLFREVWQDAGADLNGRPGQRQDGVDLFGEDRSGGSGLNGIQCKHYGSTTSIRDRDLVIKLREEVQKAKSFQPPLRRFLFATTASRSTALQEEARGLTALHQPQGLFEVQVLGWEDLEDLLRQHQDVLRWYLDRREKPREVRLDLGRLPIAGPLLIGRETELARLDAAWEEPSSHILTLVAFGGTGKSALIGRWLQNLAMDGYRGARRVLDWSFYSQGTEQGRVTSADRFLDHALGWFGDPDPKKGAARDRGLRLAELVREERTLLLLDGVEPLQHPPTHPLAGRLKDPGLAALLKSLAGANPGLCVVTTRERIADLDAFPTTAPQEDLESLSSEAGAELLKALGVKGKESELRATSKRFGNHALTLSLLGGYLTRACGGDIRRSQEVDLAGAAEKKGGHALRVIGTYASWLGNGPELAALRLLGLFDRPAQPKAIAALRSKPAIPGLTEPLVDLGEEAWQLALSNLREHGLLLSADPQQPGTLDAHPLVRVYFQEDLETRSPQAWEAGNLRLYEHLQKEAPDLPDTLEEMAPLYTAVIHGCRAGRQQEALTEIYWRRIRRGDEFYSTRKLGAFGSDLSALSGFFDRPWDKPAARLSSEAQAFVLNQAGFDLRALGRLAEAVAPMEVSLERRILLEDWKNAAISASNLSELTLTLGEVARAVSFGKQSVDLADRSGDAFQRMSKRTTLATALHQSGRLKESAETFVEAEALQAERQPEYPRLYSLRGYEYCDLLLSRGEPEAWKQVRERAEELFRWRLPEDPILDIALDHLSLGRAHLGLGDFARAAEHLDHAVEGLRRAGQEDYTTRGLLARAALRRLRKDWPGAEADLSEALEIAERGGMRLHECDAHLEWARLCADQEDPEGAKRHRARARKLVEETGYGRRRAEVERGG